MNRTILVLIRDLLNLGIYLSILLLMILCTYTTPNNEQLINLKNTLLPLNSAVFLAIISATVFVIINRITTLLITRVIKRV